LLLRLPSGEEHKENWPSMFIVAAVENESILLNDVREFMLIQNFTAEFFSRFLCSSQVIKSLVSIPEETLHESHNMVVT